MLCILADATSMKELAAIELHLTQAQAYVEEARADTDSARSEAAFRNAVLACLDAASLLGQLLAKDASKAAK
jgi:hypothetical protein